MMDGWEMRGGGHCSGSPEHPVGTTRAEGHLKVHLGLVCFEKGARKRAVAAKGACGEGLWDQHASAFGEGGVLLGRKAASRGKIKARLAPAFTNGPQLWAGAALQRGVQCHETRGLEVSSSAFWC